MSVVFLPAKDPIHYETKSYTVYTIRDFSGPLHGVPIAADPVGSYD